MILDEKINKMCLLEYLKYWSYNPEITAYLIGDARNIMENL